MRAPASFDSVVLAAVARDLRPLLGARVRAVRQPALHEVALELSGRGMPAILLSVHARWARVHLTSGAARGEAGPFAQMLRARLEGARLAGIEQPAFERVLVLEFEAESGRRTLVAELMGRHSNLILVQDGAVAGAIKLVDRGRSTVREILPGRAFTPPPRDRPRPGEIDAAELGRRLALSGGALVQALTAAVLGIGPVMARELAVRAGLDPDAPAGGADAGALHAVLEELAATVREAAFRPLVYLAGDVPVGYAPFPLRHPGALPYRDTPTMSEAVAMVTGRLSAEGNLEAERRGLNGVIRAALRKAEHAAAELRRALQEAEEGHTLRTRGELLLAYASQIPDGAAEAVLPGYEGGPVTVPLDPALTPVENARRLFDRYAKLRDARPQVSARLGAVEEERTYLESALAMAEGATGWADLDEVRRELSEEGYLRRRRPGRATAAPRPKPRTFILESGAQILAGRSNLENDHLTFKTAGPDDLWFHARGVPGAHVILRAGGSAPSPAEVAAAASAAAYFSAARAAGDVPVDYTERRYVRKPRGSRPGVVTYGRERTVRAVPRVPGA